jgi:type II secretory pathway pseudopilin PulG
MFTRTLKAQRERGLTIVESMVAAVVFGITVTTLSSIFAQQKMVSLESEMKTGAVAVSQQILDELRQTNIGNLPSSGTSTTLPSGSPTTSIANMGRTYSAVMYYCEKVTNGNADYCNATTRQVRVEVKSNGRKIYEAETVFTSLQ